jgi:hypothetical protein
MPTVVCLSNLVPPAVSLVGYEYGSNLSSVTIPVDTAIGDTTYIFAVAPSGNFDFSSGNSPTNWTSLDATSTARTWRRQWTSTPASSVDVGINSATAGLFICVSFRGQSTTPEDATTTTATGNSGSFDPPSITTVTDNAWTLAIAFCFFDLSSLSFQPSGYENNIAVRDTTNGGGLCFCSKVKSTAGAENPSTYSSFTASGSWRTATLALRPG